MEARTIKRRPLSAPARVYMNLTQRCNFACPYCYAAKEIARDDELTLDEIDGIFGQCDDLNVLLLILGGGEPMARRDFVDIIERLKGRRFSARINTNGYFIDEGMADCIGSSPLHLINVSLDGPRAVHEKFSGVRGSYARVVAGIERLVRRSVPVELEYVLTARNVDRFYDVLAAARDLGVRKVKVLPLTQVGRAGDPGALAVDYDCWSAFYLELTRRKLSRDLPFMNVAIGPLDCNACSWFMYYPLPAENRRAWLKEAWSIDLDRVRRPQGGLHCSGGIEWCVILPNGDVYGCDQMINVPELRAGNLRAQTLKGIWESAEVFQRFRGLCRDDMEGPCASCGNEWCSGSNFGEAHQTTGDILGSNARCVKARGLVT